MRIYKKTEYNLILFVVLLLTGFGSIIGCVSYNPVAIFPLLIFFLALVSLSFPLLLEADDSYLSLSWGWFNWPKRSFALQDIVVCEDASVPFDWLYLNLFYVSIPITRLDFRIYSVNYWSGYVKLSMKDGKTIFIGTSSSKRLANEINKRIVAHN
ncbi:MAG: hypothetical protein WCP97_01765 [bacterium]